MRLYSDLAPWFHLLTHPSDYAEEAAYYTRVIDEASEGRARTLLELGSGGGNNASHMKARFECTLTDLSPGMLELSRELNPECEHVEGDMRTLRLDRTFDAVFAHDAVSYLTTETDLRAAVETAAAHARPGGVVLVVPDATSESFSAGTEHGGHDGEDGRGLRYVQWTHEPDPPEGSTYAVDLGIVLRQPGAPTRVVHDRHVLGLFPDATWRRLLAGAGLDLVASTVPDPYPDEHVVYVGIGPRA